VPAGVHCQGLTATARSGSCCVLPAFDGDQGRIILGYEIPKPAYKTLTSKEKVFTILCCELPRFARWGSNGTTTFKGARYAAVSVLYFPRSDLKRWRKLINNGLGRILRYLETPLRTRFSIIRPSRL
jgi:hypothetical protein